MGISRIPPVVFRLWWLCRSAENAGVREVGNMVQVDGYRRGAAVTARGAVACAAHASSRVSASSISPSAALNRARLLSAAPGSASFSACL